VPMQTWPPGLEAETAGSVCVPSLNPANIMPAALQLTLQLTLQVGFLIPLVAAPAAGAASPPNGGTIR
jgi:hypothetical protein